MRQRVGLVAGLLIGLWMNSSAHAAPDNLNLAWVDQFVLPTYERLGTTTTNLNQSAIKFCSGPNQNGLKPLKDDYHLAMDAWQMAQLVRFGPIEFLLRGNRYQVWPDKRGQVSKHLRRLLAKKNPAQLVPDKFANASVAIQGFSALENQLYAKEALKLYQDADNGMFRCQVLKAITANLERMSKGVLADWTQGEEKHRQYIEGAAGGNDYYESDKEVGSKILNNLYTQLQLIVELKLDRPLGKSFKKARGKKAESWRSRRSLQNIQKNLDAIQSTYQVRFKPALKGKPIQQQIDQAFTKVRKHGEALRISLFDAVKDESQYDLLSQYREEVNQLKRLFVGPVPKHLDLPLGFNSLDGD